MDRGLDRGVLGLDITPMALYLFSALLITFFLFSSFSRLFPRVLPGWWGHGYVSRFLRLCTCTLISNEQTGRRNAPTPHTVNII